MQAVEYDRYGDSGVLQVREAAAPVPSGNQLLVRVHAAALNPKDVLVRKGKFKLISGRRFPQRVGYDWAGEVLQSPAGSPFQPGVRLFGMIQAWSAGACAQQVAVQPEECARMPEGLGFEQAAALPLVSLTALQALRDLGQVGPGMSVCINGASGGLGTVAIQIAGILGARVTTLSSESNLQLCRDLGAESALDYRREDAFQRSSQFDCIFDVFGNLSFGRVRSSLKPKSVYVSAVPSKRVVIDWFRTLFSGRKSRLVVVRSRRRDLETIAGWVGAGKLRPVVDRVLPLAEIRAAQDYLATKRAKGKVVLTVP